jgi:hypothetical protein
MKHHNKTDLFENSNEFGMFIGNVLLNKTRGFEQLLASLAPEFTLILLLNVRFNDLR